MNLFDVIMCGVGGYLKQVSGALVSSMVVLMWVFDLTNEVEGGKYGNCDFRL